MFRKYGYRSLIYRSLVSWEDSHLKKGRHGRIDKVNLNNKNFIHRLARNYIRHTMVDGYYETLAAAISENEVNELKRKIDADIFKIYPELKEGYNFEKGDY